MAITKPVDHAATKYVPCSRASVREHGKHPVTVSFTKDGEIIGISCPCQHSDANEALNRLGGDLCYETVKVLRKAVLSTEFYSDAVSSACKLIDEMRTGWRRADSKRNSRKELHSEGAEQLGSLVERLSSKRCSDVAGFPIAVSSVSEKVDNRDREMRVNGVLVAARDAASNQWNLFPEMIKGCTGSRLFIKNGTCIACRKDNVGRSGTAHLERESHYESVLFAIQRAVAALRRANANGRKTLEGVQPWQR